jgi:hypothetical protein
LNDHKLDIIYPSLEEEVLHSSCVINSDRIPSTETHEDDDANIFIYLETDHSCHLVNDNASPSPSTITIETCNQPVELDFQLNEFQSRIRGKFYKPLIFPFILHDYHPNFLYYLPRFNGWDHMTTEKHMVSFERFTDLLQIVHEDVFTRTFSQSLHGDFGQ